MPGTKSDARLNFRLAGELKKTIEEAAAQMGQTVSDFAISTLVQTARRILHEQQVTRLSERDRRLFAEMLDDQSTKPNQVLVKAVKRYRKQIDSLLLVDALRRALQISEQVGIRAVEVDAIDEAAREFYLRFGFRKLMDDPRHLLMPMHEIRKLKLDPFL